MRDRAKQHAFIASLQRAKKFVLALHALVNGLQQAGAMTTMMLVTPTPAPHPPAEMQHVPQHLAGMISTTTTTTTSTKNKGPQAPRPCRSRREQVSRACGARLGTCRRFPPRPPYKTCEDQARCRQRCSATLAEIDRTRRLGGMVRRCTQPSRAEKPGHRFMMSAMSHLSTSQNDFPICTLSRRHLTTSQSTSCSRHHSTEVLGMGQHDTVVRMQRLATEGLKL